MRCDCECYPGEMAEPKNRKKAYLFLGMALAGTILLILEFYFYFFVKMCV